MKHLIALALAALLGIGAVAGHQAFAASDKNAESVKDSSQDTCICIRKGNGTEDISGDNGIAVSAMEDIVGQIK